jgi:hypothetical protein
MEGIEPDACGSHTQVDEPQQLTRLISSLGIPETSHVLNKQGITEKFGTFSEI